MATKASAFCSDWVGMGAKLLPPAVGAVTVSLRGGSDQLRARIARGRANVKRGYPCWITFSATSPTICSDRTEILSIVSCRVWW